LSNLTKLSNKGQKKNYWIDIIESLKEIFNNNAVIDEIIYNGLKRFCVEIKSINMCVCEYVCMYLLVVVVFIVFVVAAVMHINYVI